MKIPWYLSFYTYYLKCRLFNSRTPILAGFKITNRCNLDCIHCPFWRRTSPRKLTFNQVTRILEKLNRMGIKILILEGGEPFLWRDGSRSIHDVVEVARSLFLSVGMTTNGSFPLEVKTNTLWVSIDGLRETHNRIRGNSFDSVIRNLRNSTHPNLYANITINRINAVEIPDLVRFLSGLVRGITIQLHYPYEKGDTLFLSAEQRVAVIDRLIGLKREGFPLADSFLCLQSLKDNSWHCQDWMLANVEPDGSINRGCYVKGRGDITCSMCGFAAHTELSLAYRWHLESIMVGRKIFRYGNS